MPPKRKLTYYGPKFRFSKKAKTTTKRRTYPNKVQLTRPLSFERKWYQQGFFPINLNPASPYAINPLYYIAQGSQQDQRNGLTLQDVNLYVTVSYTSWGTNNAAAGKFDSTAFRCVVFANPTTWRQTVVGTPESNAAGTGTVIPIGTVFMDSGLDRCTQSFLNKDYNKILYDTGRLITPPAGQLAVAGNTINGGSVSRKFMIKLGDLRYTSNGLSYLRDDNVYIWVVADALGATGTAAGDIMGAYSMNTLITWKDS